MARSESPPGRDDGPQSQNAVRTSLRALIIEKPHRVAAGLASRVLHRSQPILENPLSFMLRAHDEPYPLSCVKIPELPCCIPVKMPDLRFGKSLSLRVGRVENPARPWRHKRCQIRQIKVAEN